MKVLLKSGLVVHVAGALYARVQGATPYLTLSREAHGIDPLFNANMAEVAAWWPSNSEVRVRSLAEAQALELKALAHEQAKRAAK